MPRAGAPRHRPAGHRPARRLPRHARPVTPQPHLHAHFRRHLPGPDRATPVAQLPWGHVTVLLDKLTEPAERDRYAAAAVEYGWTRNVLTHQIMNRLHDRAGAALSDFTAQLPAADSELAQQLTRDPYVLDFLDLTGRAAERDLEDALIGRLLPARARRRLPHRPAVLQLGPVPTRRPRAQDRPLPARTHRPAQLLRRLGRREPARPRPALPHHRDPAVRRPQRQRRPLLPRQHHRAARRCRLHLRHPARPRTRRRAHCPPAHRPRRPRRPRLRAFAPPDNPTR